MATIAGPAILSEIDLYQTFTAVPSGWMIGQRAYGPGGKIFRLALVGGSNLVTGNLLQSSAVDTQFDDMAVPAAVAANTAADSGVTITNGTTAVTANQFDGGTAEVSVTPGLGEEYTVVAHGTAANGAAWTLYLDRPIRTAWTTSTKITVRRNPWSGVIQIPTTLTGTPAGVALAASTAATYAFVQTHGVAAVLSDNSTFAVGSALSNSAATAGCAGVVVAATARCIVGHAMRAAASGKTIPVFLQID